MENQVTNQYNNNVNTRKRKKCNKTRVNMIRLNKNVCLLITGGLLLFLLCFNWIENRNAEITKTRIANHPIFQLNYENYIIKSYVNDYLQNDLASNKTHDSVCNSDKGKTNLIRIDFKSKTPSDLQTLFHKLVGNPHGGRCPSLQRFGGIYQEGCQYWDGHKFVCMSELQHDIKNNLCLIYSFGISTDWSFEEAMDDFGCRVLMFDPTVNHPNRLGNNISFEKIGLSAMKDEENSLDTLSSILQKHGHTDTKITYLKIDIEGYEVDGFLEWFQSGALNNVQQIGLEFHLPDTERTLKFFYGLAKIYSESDFRLVSYDINGCAGKEGWMYTKYAEIVLMRSSKTSICIEEFTDVS